MTERTVRVFGRIADLSSHDFGRLGVPVKAEPTVQIADLLASADDVVAAATGADAVVLDLSTELDHVEDADARLAALTELVGRFDDDVIVVVADAPSPAAASWSSDERIAHKRAAHRVAMLAIDVSMGSTASLLGVDRVVAEVGAETALAIDGSLTSAGVDVVVAELVYILSDRGLYADASQTSRDLLLPESTGDIRSFKVTEWLVAEGDSFAEGDDLCTLKSHARRRVRRPQIARDVVRPRRWHGVTSERRDESYGVMRVTANAGGRVLRLSVSPGVEVQPGDTIGVVEPAEASRLGAFPVTMQDHNLMTAE